MKQRGIGRQAACLLAAVCLLAALSACAPGPAVKILADGTALTLDAKAQTVSDGTNVYRYAVYGDTGNRTIEITYPNGAVYRQEARDGFSTGTGSFGTEGFADPYAMCELIADSVPKPAIDRLGGGLLILLGLVGLLSPRTAWQLECGWRYQNAEPSSLALGLNRAAGVLGIAIGCWLIWL